MSGCLPQVPRPPGRLPPPFRIGASLASQEPPNPSPRTLQLDLSQGPVHSPAQPHVPPVRHSLGSIPLKRDGNRSRGETECTEVGLCLIHVREAFILFFYIYQSYCFRLDRDFSNVFIL